MAGSKTAVAIGTAALIAGSLWMLEPKVTPEQYQQQRSDQQISDLSDSHEQTTDRMRQDGLSQAEAEQAKRNIPSEPRPAEKPRIKIRLRP